MPLAEGNVLAAAHQTDPVPVRVKEGPRPMLEELSIICVVVFLPVAFGEETFQKVSATVGLGTPSRRLHEENLNVEFLTFTLPLKSGHRDFNAGTNSDSAAIAATSWSTN